MGNNSARSPPATANRGSDADVAEIRARCVSAVGDLPIYGGSGLDAFNFPGCAASLHRAQRAVK